jgi:DNA-binding beta-propeller fold protein YncE
MKKLIRLRGTAIRCFTMSVAASITIGSFVSTQAGAKPNDTVIATISLNGSLFPQSIVLNPKKPEAYVSCSFGNIYGIDTTTNTISFTYQAGNDLESMGISPDGQTLYVVEFGGIPNIQWSLVQFSIANQQEMGSLPIVADAEIPAVSPDGSLVYLPERFTGVGVFTTNPFSQTDVVGSYKYPNQAVFTPDGTHAYITDLGIQATAGFLNYIDVARGSSTTIKGARLTQPFGIAISPNGGTVYVTQPDSFNSAGAEKKGVVIVDTATNKISSAVSVVAPGANAPNYASLTGLPGITPDGAYLYVPIPYTTYTDPATGNTSTYDAKTVAVINTKTRKVVDQMTLEWDPQQVVIGAGNRAYVLYAVNGVATVAVIDITGS